MVDDSEEIQASAQFYEKLNERIAFLPKEEITPQKIKILIKELAKEMYAGHSVILRSDKGPDQVL